MLSLVERLSGTLFTVQSIYNMEVSNFFYSFFEKRFLFKFKIFLNGEWRSHREEIINKKFTKNWSHVLNLLKGKFYFRGLVRVAFLVILVFVTTKL